MAKLFAGVSELSNINEVQDYFDFTQFLCPFEVLSDCKRRSRRLRASGTTTTTKNKTKFVRDAEIALVALSACEEAQEREVFIATS